MKKKDEKISDWNIIYDHVFYIRSESGTARC
jgi:hypothetical protein